MKTIKDIVKYGKIRSIVKRIHRFLGKIRLFFYRRKYNHLLWKSENKENENNPNKMIFVCHSADKSGGASLLSYNMVMEYIRRGIMVSVVILDGGELIEDFAKIAPTFLGVFSGEIRRRVRELHRCGYEYAICNSVRTGNVVRMLKDEGLMVTSLIHELPESIKTMGCLKEAKNMSFYSDRVLFASSYIEKRFQKEINRINGKVEIIPQGIYNFVNLDSSMRESKKMVSERFRLDIDKPYIINVGKITERKGTDFFLSIAKKCEEVNFLWVGSSDNTKWASQQIDDSKTISNVRFLGQINDKILLSHIYNSANAFILTSREEPFASVVLESLFYGTPVIAFNEGGGHVDIICNGINGFLVDFGDIDAAAQIVKKSFGRDTNIYDEKCKESVSGFDFGGYCDKVVSFTNS